MDEQRASQCPDGTYEMKAAQDFKYKSLAKELHVGEVYLRVYNEQPDYELSQADFFCESLLKFICKLVEERKKLNMMKNSAEMDKPNVEEASSELSQECESQTDTKQSIENSLVQTHEDMSPQDILVKDLTTGLTALQVCGKTKFLI